MLVTTVEKLADYQKTYTSGGWNIEAEIKEFEGFRRPAGGHRQEQGGVILPNKSNK